MLIIIILTIVVSIALALLSIPEVQEYVKEHVPDDWVSSAETIIDVGPRIGKRILLKAVRKAAEEVTTNLFRYAKAAI